MNNNYLVDEYLEKLSEIPVEQLTTKKGLEKHTSICKEARKVVKPIKGFTDLRFNGKTVFGNDKLPGIKKGGKYTFFYACGDIENEPFNFTVGEVKTVDDLQIILAKEAGTKTYKFYYVNAYNYALKDYFEDEEFKTVNEALKYLKENS